VLMNMLFSDPELFVTVVDKLHYQRNDPSTMPLCLCCLLLRVVLLFGAAFIGKSCQNCRAEHAPVDLPTCDPTIMPCFAASTSLLLSLTRHNLAAVLSNLLLLFRCLWQWKPMSLHQPSVNSSRLANLTSASHQLYTSLRNSANNDMFVGDKISEAISQSNAQYL
jgi:recombinational DNA repair protein (RecF pathway)